MASRWSATSSFVTGGYPVGVPILQPIEDHLGRKAWWRIVEGGENRSQDIIAMLERPDGEPILKEAQSRRYALGRIAEMAGSNLSPHETIEIRAQVDIGHDAASLLPRQPAPNYAASRSGTSLRRALSHHERRRASSASAALAA